MLEGKAGILMPRDESILTEIYFTGFLTTKQIVDRHFPDPEYGRQRLYALRKKKMLTNWTVSRQLNLWKLTKGAFDREIESLHREDERFKKWPKRDYIPHYVDTNDLFVAICGDLDGMLGKHPAWEWKDESRAFRRYEFGGDKRYHQPDAEVHFGGRIYFIERQTERSRKTGKEIEEKIRRYKGYRTSIDRDDLSAQLLFACDTQRDLDYAVKAADKHQVPTYADTLQGVADHLKKEAGRLEKRAS